MERWAFCKIDMGALAAEGNSPLGHAKPPAGSSGAAAIGRPHEFNNEFRQLIRKRNR
jgi:hypothetical protein